MQQKLSTSFAIFLTCLILTFISLFSISCQDSSSSESEKETSVISEDETTEDDDISDNTTEDEPDAIDDDASNDLIEDEPIVDIKKKPPVEATPDLVPLFLVKTEDSLYFANHDEMELWKTGEIDKAGPRLFSVENELIELDASGDVIDTITLDHTPVRIKSTSAGNYYCVEIPPEEAYSKGALYRIYTEIYKDGFQISEAWYYNKFECKDIVSADGNIFLIDEFGAYHVVEGAAENVAHVHDDDFYIHDIDYIDDTIEFNDSTYDFIANFVTMSRQWINYNGQYYSEWGDIWSEDDGLFENVTTMNDFNIWPYPVVPELSNGEAPTLLSVGEAAGLLYWIECNSGFLFEYDATNDTLTQKWKLYFSNNTRAVGVIKRDTLKPLIVNDKLYFSNQSAIYSVNLGDGIINIFYGGNGEVLRYE
jgi:hypothetical protein